MTTLLAIVLSFAMAKAPSAYEKLLADLTPREKKLREEDRLMLKTFDVIVGKFNRDAKVFELRIVGEEEVGPNFATPENLEKATREKGLAEKLLRNPESFEETTLDLKDNLELAPTPAKSK